MMDNLTPKQIERLARLAHETYLRSPQNPNRIEPGRCKWDDGLAETFKESNRDAVRHKLDDLTRLGYIVVGKASAPEHARFSLDEHLEWLAEREHNRWIAFMIEAGYSVGSERCDDPPKKAHPDLVPWAELSDETREKDRALWRDFIQHLAELDLAITSKSAAT